MLRDGACAGTVLVACLTLTVPLIADNGTPWVEARTANVIVFSGAGEAAAREVAREIETLRASLAAALGDDAVQTHEPVVAIAVNGARAFRELAPHLWERRGPKPPALASSGPYTQYVALRTDIPARVRGPVLRHEYVHLLVHARDASVPAWLDEGLAEFWSHATTTEDGLVVGAPIAYHVPALGGRGWIPIADLVAVPRGEYDTNPRRSAQFYAQAWALVHYLLAGPGAAGGPAPFVPDTTRLGDLAALDQALRAYVREGRYRTAILPWRDGADPAVPASPEVRPVSDADALAVRGAFLLTGIRPERAAPLLDRALALAPGHASALEARGVLEFLGNRMDSARKWLEMAVEAPGSGYRAHYYYAVVMAGQPAVAARHLTRSLELRPGFVPACQRMAGLAGKFPLDPASGCDR